MRVIRKFAVVSLLVPVLAGLAAVPATAGMDLPALPDKGMKPCLDNPTAAVGMATIAVATMNPTGLGRSCELITKPGAHL